MIVPRNRLLWTVAILLLPASALGAAERALVPQLLGVATLLVLVAAADAAFGRRRLAGVAVELPPILRLTEQREGEIEVVIVHPHASLRRLRAGLLLPSDLTSATEDQIVLLPENSQRATLRWSVTASRRGRYDIKGARLAATSPLGFWEARITAPAQSEVRVYPNLMRERDNVAALLLRKGSLGLHVQRQVGKGREFEKLREYAAGDSFEDIHWKATARRGLPITKVFQVERTQEIYVIIDASRLSARTIETGTTVLERFVTAALILGLAAEQQGDLFGVIAYTDKVLRFLRAKNGAAHFTACRDALYSLQAESVTPDIEELCAFLRVRLRRRALLIFLSELDDPLIAESFSRQINLLSRHHLVLANMVQPASAVPLFSGAEPTAEEEIYEHLGGHLRWRKLKEFEATLRSQGVRFSVLDPDHIGLQLTTLYRQVKQRQLL